MNRRFVADASVAIKLCIPEAHSDRALALFKSGLAGNLLFVPDLS
jgi:predicted nucleic acid-binding protein